MDYVYNWGHYDTTLSGGYYSGFGKPYPQRGVSFKRDSRFYEKVLFRIELRNFHFVKDVVETKDNDGKDYILVILKKTCGPNNSNFKKSFDRREYIILKKEIERKPYRVKIVDMWDNEIEKINW